MAKEEKKRAKNLDDFLDQLAQEHSQSLDESFKAFDAFTKDENQLHMYNHILAPAQDALYNALVSTLDNEFDKNDDTKLEKAEQHNKVKKAVGKALRAYFDKTHPHVIKAMDDLKMNDEDQYEHLIQLYDEHIGANPRNEKNPGLRAIVDSLMRQKRTVGHVKKVVYDAKSAAAAGAMENLNERYVQHHFSQYNPTQIAAYLKPRIEKEGFEIKDKLSYAQSNLDNLLNLLRNIIEKEGHPYLKKKEVKK